MRDGEGLVTVQNHIHRHTEHTAVGMAPVNLSRSPRATDTKKCFVAPTYAKGKKYAQWSAAFISLINKDEDLDHSEVSSFEQVMLSG